MPIPSIRNCIELWKDTRYILGIARLNDSIIVKEASFYFPNFAHLHNMPVFRLSSDISFPHPKHAEPDGLLAVGGDLSPKRLLAAYRHGIFPWYSKGDPILWWYTHPRLAIIPREFTTPKRLQRYRRNTSYILTTNQNFEQVMSRCASTRENDGEETWILPEMKKAYLELHKLGYAHSIECWDGEELVGGLYGLGLDRVFFGESMFSTVSNSSKFSLMYLVEIAKDLGIELIDCQMTTEHLLQFGAKELSGKEFYIKMQSYIENMNPQQRWPR